MRVPQVLPLFAYKLPLNTLSCPFIDTEYYVPDVEKPCNKRMSYGLFKNSIPRIYQYHSKNPPCWLRLPYSWYTGYVRVVSAIINFLSGVGKIPVSYIYCYPCSLSARSPSVSRERSTSSLPRRLLDSTIWSIWSSKIDLLSNNNLPISVSCRHQHSPRS